MITKVKGKMITESRKLRESFNDMDMLRSDKQSVDAILRGLVDDHSEKVDNTFVDDVRLQIPVSIEDITTFFHIHPLLALMIISKVF